MTNLNILFFFFTELTVSLAESKEFEELSEKFILARSIVGFICTTDFIQSNK